MCHLSLLGCPSRNSLPQSTRNPPAIHAQANPTLRPRPCPPPCSVFRLGFFPSRNSNTQKAKAKTPNTHTPPARSGLLFPTHPFGVFGGVGGVNTNDGAIGIVSSRGSVSFLPQSHPSRLSFSWQRCAGRWRRRQQRRHRCAGGSQGRFSVVLVARGGSLALCWWHRCLFCPRYVVAFTAPAAWLRFAAAAAFRRQHISSWFSRFCLGLFSRCSVRRGFSLRRGSRSHAGCSGVF